VLSQLTPLKSLIHRSLISLIPPTSLLLLLLLHLDTAKANAHLRLLRRVDVRDKVPLLVSLFSLSSSRHGHSSTLVHVHSRIILLFTFQVAPSAPPAPPAPAPVASLLLLLLLLLPISPAPATTTRLLLLLLLLLLASPTPAALRL